MMYHDKTRSLLTNLNRFDLVGIAISGVPKTPYKIYAERYGSESLLLTVAWFETEQEAIAELKYIAKEMNK